SVVADKSAFMIKHEDIPGVMRAMTMMFKVDAAALKAFKVGDAVTGQMSRQGTSWVLEDVKPAAPKPAK
ncbi:MAG: copper-binding protein, partial [Opitutaceae bacterium]